jgi:hypothetical protein
MSGTASSRPRPSWSSTSRTTRPVPPTLPTWGCAQALRQWIVDTADANYDQAWLDYQYEIGLRHTTPKKNQTDKADSVPLVNFRYLSALTIPVTTTLKPFLAKKGASAADVEKMHAAWVKSVLMQTILWSYPYIKDGQF